jgi:hypothetical protein
VADQGLDARKRRAQVFRLGAAGLREVRAAAATPAYLRSYRASDIAGLQARHQIRGNTGNQHYFAVLHGREDDHRRAKLLLELID